MPAPRSLARLAGALYLVTFATSIPALLLKQPFLDVGVSTAAPNLAAAHGAIVLELLLALSCIGTAVALYPVTRRHGEALALGFVASRILEAAAVLLGAIALLALVATRATADAIGATNAHAADQSAVDAALVALHDAAFLLGPGLLPAVNALLLGTLLFRSRLVPRVIPLVGLIGAPLLAASALASLFGLVDQVSPLAGLAALPIALWEFSVGVWLLLKGVPDAEVTTTVPPATVLPTPAPPTTELATATA